MALAPLTPTTKPIKSPGLFDAAKAGGQTFEQWNAASGDTDAMPSIAPAQVNDSMADKVTALSSQDSKLNQMARTEGLKAANRRGLLNSSMAVGASQDAVLKNVMPIASQDSAQDFARNQASRAFEFSMAGQNDAQAFQRGQAELDRNLQRAMQQNSLTAAQAAQIRDIASREGLAKADIAFRTSQNALDRTLQQTIANLNVGAEEKRTVGGFISGMEDIYRSTVQSIMANTSLSAAQREQQLTAAKALRDRQLDFAQQIWSVQLDWGQPGSPTATPAPAPAPKPAPAAAKPIQGYTNYLAATGKPRDEASWRAYVAQGGR